MPEVVFFDTEDGGLKLERDDAVEFILYVAELEAWAKLTMEQCKHD